MSYTYGDEFESGYVSNCCGAAVKWTDICNSCGEHCEPVPEEEEE